MRELIGLTIVAVKGDDRDYSYDGKLKKVRKKLIEPEVIFFSDGETYLKLEEQDYYEYHDCCQSARMIEVRKDKQAYSNMFNSLIDSNINL